MHNSMIMIFPNFNSSMTVRFLKVAIILFISSQNSAQDIYERNESADVESYVFNLTLNDNNNIVEGESEITIVFRNEIASFSLDLIGKSEKYGMNILSVSEDSVDAQYTFLENKIKVNPRKSGDSTRVYKIRYRGIPERGLVIDTTKFGQRSFFGDNWPNLARHWLACVDHPYDKAFVEFRITAPNHYDVVATGKKIEESNLGKGMKLTTYREPAPVAMKVATIGVTRFATKLLDTVDDIPVTAWVYPENRLDGFSDYNIAVNVLNYFIEHIGPYPYAKLANMQAKTQWGGLENAGTISYFENSVTGKNTVEGLIAHEISHQWFGNSATENSWNHVWLSEGFATYFTILYQEHVYGDEKRKEELALDKKQIIAYYKRNPSPIVDNSIKDPMKVLSTNTYQKGGWVLNMLRHRLGDDVFWKGIRLYYETYKNSNAMTADLRRTMEEVSGHDLKEYFNQWIFTKGHPIINWEWKYKGGKIFIDIKQLQDHHIFKFPIEIGIVTDGQMSLTKLDVDLPTKSFTIETDKKPDEIVLDPELWLLYEVIE